MTESTPLTILLIEDNPGDARLVMEALSEPWDNQPVEILSAGSLSAGLDFMKSRQINAILLDLSLPDSSGEETFHQIFEAGRYTPIILLTGMQDDELVQNLIRAGAQDYMQKGEMDEKTLRRSIRYAMQRKVSEDNLRASEERFRLLIEQASDGIFTTDLEGRILDVNRAGCAMVGYTREELLQLKMSDLELGDPAARRQAVAADLDSGKTFLMSYEFRHKDGHPVPVEISAKTLPDGRRQGIVRDITARRQAEEALNQSNEFNQILIQTLPFMMEIVDEDGNIIFVSPGSSQSLETSLIGKRCWDLHKDDKTQCENCPLKFPIQIGKTNVTQIKGIHGGRTYEVAHTGLIYQGRRALLEVFQGRTPLERRMRSVCVVLDSVLLCQHLYLE
ncbi:MAG: PAS domain S-box protein [Chloroflexota bacterium]